MQILHWIAWEKTQTPAQGGDRVIVVCAAACVNGEHWEDFETLLSADFIGILD